MNALVNSPTATGRYRFNSLVLKDCPPLGDRSYVFEKGLNLLTGENGTGKTAILNALKVGSWPYGGRVSVLAEGDRSLVTRYPDLVDLCPWRAFGKERPDGHWSHMAFGNADIESRMTTLLEEMMRPKVGVMTTKFAGIPDCGVGTFQVVVHQDGDIVVHAGPALRGVEYHSPYGSVEQLFVAYGEKFLLQLSGILAVREFLGLDLPLLMDDGLSGLDAILAGSLVRFLARRDFQVIISARPDVLDTIRGLNSATVVRI